MAAVIDAGPNHDTTHAVLNLAPTADSVDLSFYSRLRQPQATSSVLA
jgi:hypothetical protein